MEGATQPDKNTLPDSSGRNSGVEALTYIHWIEQNLGTATAAMAGCRSAVASMQEELSISKVVMYQQLQNSARNTSVNETLLVTNHNMAKEIEHLLRLNRSHQDDSDRWNVINHNLQKTIRQLREQIVEKDIEIHSLKGHITNDCADQITQSPIPSAAASQVLECSDMTDKRQSDECKCPQVGIAQIGLFVAAADMQRPQEIQINRLEESAKSEDPAKGTKIFTAKNNTRPVLRRQKQVLTER